MVNTNDFRRYSYDSDAAYALEAFNKNAFLRSAGGSASGKKKIKFKSKYRQ